MKRFPHPLRLGCTCAVAVPLVLLAGCRSSGEIVDEGLNGPHPAKTRSADDAAARPPVEPDRLAIAATPLGPTETTAVDPEPILPKMDSFFKGRRLPAGYEQYASPVTRPAEREPMMPEIMQGGEGDER